MKSWIKNYSLEVAFGMLLILIMVFYQWNRPNPSQQIINWDGEGYYMYLPATFIQKDLTFEKSFEVKKFDTKTNGQSHFLIKDNQEKYHNKYYPGVPLLQLPFFLIAHSIASLTIDNPTGYEFIYAAFMNIGALFYLLLGLYYLRKFLELYSFSHKEIGITIFSLLIGTTLLFQFISFTLFAHIYSFSAFAYFAFLIKKKEWDTPFFIKLGITLGIIAVLRPVNLIVVFSIPFILGKWKDLSNLFSSGFKPKNLILFITLFSIGISPIFVNNYIQYGDPLNWGYGGEGFKGLEFFETLFSFRTGFLIQTPIAILAIIGIVRHAKTNLFESLSWLSYFVIITLLISSWWCWDYAGTFGHRSYTEHLVIFSVPLVYFYKQAKRKWVPISIFTIFALIMSSRIIQLELKIIPHRLTATNYFSSIFQFGEFHKGKYAFTHEVEPYGENTLTETLLENGNRTFNESTEFGFDVEYTFPKDKSGKNYSLQIELDKKLDSKSDFRGVYFVVDAIDTTTNERLYWSLPLYDYYKESINSFDHYKFDYFYTFNSRMSFDKAKFYIWNSEKKSFEIKNYNFKIEEFTP